MTYFDNQYIGKCVCIDWDLFYEDFFGRGAYRYAIALIRNLLGFMGLEPQDIDVFYQRSPNGNVHLAIRFPQSLSVLDGFMIRAWMSDDAHRLKMDLGRYARTGSLYEMNRCFQAKIHVKDGIGTQSNAGEWIRLNISETEGLPTATEAHTFIEDRVDECRSIKHGKKVTDDGQARLS